MKLRDKTSWHLELGLSVLPMLIEIVFRSASQRSDFLFIAGQVISGTEGSVFAFIIVLTTMAHIVEKYKAKKRDVAYKLFVRLLFVVIALLVANICNLLFNVPNDLTTVTCFLDGTARECPFMMKAVTTEPSIHIGWLVFNLAGGIISVRACNGIRNEIASP